jgi:hypothetical protein
VLTLIEPKGLLIEIGVKVNWVNADVGSLERPLQEAPEVLDAVGVYAVANELDGVIDSLVIVGVAKAEIRFQRIGIDGGSRLDAGANLGCQGAAFYIRNVRCLDAAGSIVRTALDNAEDRFFARAASPFDFLLAHVPMHILSETADVAFVGFDLARHFDEGSGLHRQSDSVIHEPSGLLSYAERPMHFVAADSVIAVGDHPDCREPFPKVDWAILENRSDLGRELATRMRLFAFPNPAGRDEARIGTPTGGAMHTVRPAQFNHRTQRDIGVREVTDCFDEGLGFGGCVRHADQYDRDRALCQVYYYPKKGLDQCGDRADRDDLGQ